MGDLIIKPASSGSLKIQDQAGTAHITTGTSSGLTLGTAVTFPAGHIIQVKFVEFTGTQTIGNGSSTGTTFVNIGSGVSGQEFSIDMSVSSGNKILGFCNINLTGSGRYSGIKVFADSTQIAKGTAEGNRPAMTVSAQINEQATNDVYVMHNSSFIFNHTPSDTSSHTYKIQAGNTYSASTYTRINRNNVDDNNAYNHRGYSHFMLMEIAQ